jgi:hypothetical protein
MEHVNDDMDELFRKAGELYPLRTTDSDWEGVSGKLRDEISREKGMPYSVPPRDGSNRRKWLLLFLVPALVFSLIYFTRSSNDEKIIHSPANSKNLVENKNENASLNSTGSSANVNKEIPAGANTSLNSGKSTSGARPANSLKIDSDEITDKSSVSKGNRNNNITSEINSENTSGQSAINQTGSDLIYNPGDQKFNRDAASKPLLLSVYGSNKNPNVYGTPLPDLKQTHLTGKSEYANTGKKASSNKSVNSKGIYAVLIGGPDWSTVALQSTEQAGYSVGILAGYRFNKRFSIETGVLWDKKNYYSDGKYFEKSKASIPDTVNLKNLNGFCNMFEIPINLRYSFASSNNHNFFLALGLSSYLMKKEYYDYTAEKTYWGGVVTYSGNTTYKNSTNNFFSVLQISGGYEYSIGKSTEIRIEPYVKIPLQGLGIGSMPISSAGLYFGISHSFR